MAGQLADHAKIIDAVQMIGMRMRQQHRVEPADPGIEQLLPQIGRGIDQQRATAALDQQRAAAAPVARVGRVAAPPIRPDRRHAPGGAAAEHA